LAFFAAEAVAELGSQHLVDLVDLRGQRGAGVGDGDEPDPAIIGLGASFDESSGLQAVDHGADRCAPDTEVVREIGLGRRAELVDVAEQRRLREVEVERGESGVECNAHEPRGGHQCRLDAEPGWRIEFVGGEVAHGGSVTLGVDTYCTLPYSIATAGRREDLATTVLEDTTMTDTATGLTDTEAAEFRQQCVDFMEQFAPGQNPTLDDQKAFLAAAAEAGLAGLPVASEYGGGGKTLAHEKIWREVKGNYPMPDSEFIISHGMCMPMLAEYGTHEQKDRFLADNISGKTMWCQMFSEPGAGSDVASLQTKAELDGDEWVLNGQKVWTTLAHKSDYGLVVARTDPDQVKHAGISMFVLDMRGQGVEIRPIHQIDGGSHFNEVFMSDARIPKDWLVGDLNNGWNLATAMLMYERVAIGGAGAGKINQPNFKMLRKAAESTGQIDNPVVRDQMMKIWSMETCKSLVAMKTRDELKAGKTPGPGGSLGKLFGSNIAWKVREMALEFAGPGSVAWDADDEGGAELQRIVLNSFQSSIAGGTDEIQRNIIGDRVLGLPREPSVDRGVAFRDLKVGTQTT